MASPKIFKGDKLRSTQQHPSANFSEPDLVFKKISVTKYTQPEPEAKKICLSTLLLRVKFTLNSSVNRLQHDEAGNRISVTIFNTPPNVHEGSDKHSGDELEHLSTNQFLPSANWLCSKLIIASHWWIKISRGRPASGTQ